MSKIYKIIIFAVLLISITNMSFATEEIIKSQLETLNISSLIESGNKYINENFSEMDVNDLLNQALTGSIDKNILYKSLLKVLGNEFILGITTISTIIAIIIIHSIIKSISENLANKGVGQIAYFVEYVLIVGILMSNFSVILSSIRNSIQDVTGYINSLVPILLALVTTMGNIVTVNFIQPLIIFSIVFITNAINNFIIPIVLVATIIGIVGNLSEKVQIGKLSKFFKSSVLWVLGIIITIFTSILSVEGTITSNLDGLALKGIKTATTTFVPIVGKALGESADTVLGCTNIIKNGIGVVGIIMVIIICAVPIIKLAVLTIAYYFTAAICEPVADKKIVDVIGQIAGTFKVLLAIMFFVATMFIIGFAMVLKISNSGMMYR